MLYLVIFIILLIFTILLSVKANILIEYLRDGVEDHFVLSFFTFGGLIKYKYEIPLIDLQKTGIKLKKYKEKGQKEKTVGEDKRFFGFYDIYEKYDYFKSFYKQNRVLICKIKEYLRRKVTLNEYYLEITFGTGNASHTGVLGGFIWAVVGIVTSYLANNFKIIKKSVAIKPDFVEKKLSIDVYCIFSVKIVHIIVVVIRIMLDSRLKKKIIKKAIGGDVIG